MSVDSGTGNTEYLPDFPGPDIFDLVIVAAGTVETGDALRADAGPYAGCIGTVYVEE